MKTYPARPGMLRPGTATLGLVRCGLARQGKGERNSRSPFSRAAELAPTRTTLRGVHGRAGLAAGADFVLGGHGKTLQPEVTTGW